jgi:hypothetical protein
VELPFRITFIVKQKICDYEFPTISKQPNVSGYFMTTNRMTIKLFSILTFFILTIGCNTGGQNKATSISDTNVSHKNITTKQDNDLDKTIEIDCDTVYENKGFRLVIKPLDKNKANEINYNFVFRVIKHIKGQDTEIFRDTIESTTQEIKFSDFNNDNTKDILIQNISDVRSNWTYNLYLVNLNKETFQKIKGFGEIKNPNYLPKYNLIDNMVMSGRNWTSFYKIEGDTIKDFDIVIYDGEDDNGKVTYDKDYKKAINQILKNEKNNR